jgi:negative regulator of flagellin synthesis FlgM
MKITPSTPVVNSTGNSNSAPAETKKTAEASAAPELKSTALRKALEASSDVDMNKVAQVRQAIAQGELSLDPDVLAEAVVNLHRK